MSGTYMRRAKTMTAKRGSRVTAEEIYYITISPMRIENYRNVPAAHPRPFLNTPPAFPSLFSSIPTSSSLFGPLFDMFSLMDAVWLRRSAFYIYFFLLAAMLEGCD
jgi:hypothetical protein